ncbi:hypothetical protein MBM09_09445 [Flaviramulus sp. BrNp1-15]|uniref:hypothetical protein n=1 Tax=Flaviramulus sp. BrNp1-15 TaxID=2916754 RepID=UPI001EE8DD66|nr:hypothetical protein [Flaviramulus sp. BrNp1-15]ULC58142.1 hypothetical protein MBM09_09445 [Flaviramulus sp. BrNp1-15]
MALNELKENLSGVNSDVHAYIEHNKEYYKLLVFRTLMKSITSLTKMLFTGTIVVFILFLIALTTSIGIGQAIGNMFYGFLIVSLFFLIVGIILYLLRHKLDKPILKKFSEYYFNKI